MNNDTHIEDAELRGLVQQLATYADIEASLRGAMMVEGKGATKRRDQMVRGASRRVDVVLREHTLDPERRGLFERAAVSLRGYARAFSRSRHLGAAVEAVKGARRISRTLVDARAAAVGVHVPPIGVATLAPAGLLGHVQTQAHKMMEHGGLDGIDLGLAGKAGKP